MHSLGIVHRDLKLENILMHDTGGGQYEVKIADFGLSCLIPVGEGGYDLNSSVKRKKFDKCDDMWGTRVSEEDRKRAIELLLLQSYWLFAFEKLLS